MKLKTFVKENTWLNFTDHGWGNGYVIIPKGHKYYGVDYDNIPVNVHGGLTFSDYANTLDWSEIKDKEGWVVGFDTAHYGDNSINRPRSWVVRETNKLRKQLELDN